MHLAQLKLFCLVGTAFCLAANAAEPPVTAAPTFVGEAAALREIEKRLPRIAQSEGRVLLLGETGTGKEIYARRIHAMSPRALRPFIAVSIADLNPNLVDAALFGVKKGSFTGADRDTTGLFEAANGGTLFLDELGEMPKAAQLKLLRVLEEGTVRPVGANEERAVDVRVISATNSNLEDAVENETFREDLFYRLNVFTLTLPPLRERKDDLFLLVEHFQSVLENRNSVLRGKVFSQQALMKLQEYHWPGNLRELRSAVEHALVVSDSQVIGVEDLPAKIARYDAGTPTPSKSSGGNDGPTAGRTLKEVLAAHCLSTYQRLGTAQAAAKELQISPRTLSKHLDSAKGASDP